MPRETPLSIIHLKGLLTLQQRGRDDPVRGAGLLPRRRDDRRPRRLHRRPLILDQLGARQHARRALGPVSDRRVRHAPAEGVRSMFDRIAPVYDLMNRVMTVGLDQRWRRLTAGRSCGRATACSTPAAAPAISRSPRAKAGRARWSGLDFSRADARARAAQGPGDRVDPGRPAGAAVRGRVVRRRHGRLRRPQRRRPRARAAELRRVLRPGGRLGILEITRPRGLLAALLPALVRRA